MISKTRANVGAHTEHPLSDPEIGQQLFSSLRDQANSRHDPDAAARDDRKVFADDPRSRGFQADLVMIARGPELNVRSNLLPPIRVNLNVLRNIHGDPLARATRGKHNE